MQHLDEKWLKILNYYYVFFSTIMLFIYVLFASRQKTLAVTGVDAFGLNVGTAALCLATILYGLFFIIFVRKYNKWLGYVLSFFLFGIMLSMAVEPSIGTAGETFYIVNIFILNIFAVAYGPLASLTVIGISGIVLGMEIAGTTEPTSAGLTGDVLRFAGRTIITALLLFMFRKKYVVDAEDASSYIEHYFVSNEVVRLLTNSIGDGVIIIDNKEVIKTANPAALSILGQESKDVIDLNYRSVLKFKNINGSNVAPDKEPITVALKDRKSVREELSLPKNNESIYVDVTVSVIANENNDKDELYGAVITLRDVSKKKKDEAARSEFISTASHEMRTPVAAIEGYLALALNPNVVQVDPKTRDFLQKAYASTQHLGQLFQDLLVSTRAEDGRLVSHPEVIEIGELLQRQADYFSIIAQKKGLQFEFAISTLNKNNNNNKALKPLYFTYADPARIQEVTTNLIDNAIKYTSTGKITVGLTGNRSVVQMFVGDTGVGIDPEDVPHLFQKFYRVDNSATRTTGGTGLGLFICRKIVELYKGQIWVQSIKGQGSTFYINLPRLDSTQANALRTRDATRKNRQV